VPVFDDQAILSVRIALSALCRGRSRIDLAQMPGTAAEVLLRALRLLGVESETRRSESGGCELDVVGRGLLSPLAEPGVLDVRGVSDVAGLLVGLLAGRVGSYELLVDQRVAEAVGPFLVPLGALTCEEQGDGSLLRLRWPEGARISGFELEASGHFPWLKQAALLIGLRAESETTVLESAASADHLERALARARAPIKCAGSLITLHPPRDADALSPDRYGPIGSALSVAHMAAAALSVPESRIELRDVSINPSGPDVAGLVRLLGGGASVRPSGDVQGEPVGDVTLSGRLGHGDPGRLFVVSGESAMRAGDALFPLLVAAARGVGLFAFPELVGHARGGDPRIVERSVGVMRQAGVTVELEPGQGARTLTVVGQGDRAFRALRLTTGGDGRLAALGTLMAMGSEEPSLIDDVDCLRDEFPRFVGTLRALGARLEMQAA